MNEIAVIVLAGGLIVGGRMVAHGHKADIPEDKARSLSAKGYVAIDGEEVAREGSVVDADTRLALIIDEIANLEDDDFTKGGLPDVKALEERLGFDISADERTGAWEAHQAAQGG